MPTDPQAISPLPPSGAVETPGGMPDSLASQVWRRLSRNPRTIVAMLIVATMIAMALFADMISPYDYKAQHRGSELVAPSAAHWFGTDELGRDVLSRVMYGAQVSMLVGVCATALSLCIGILVGLLSGYFSGPVDAVLMRLTDTVAAFPSLLLAVAIAALYERTSVLILFLALGLVGWTGIARIVRAQVLTLRTLDYVSAARALGASDLRIMLRHILPNCVSPIIVVATLAVGGNILSEAGLSFLGLGVQDPFPSWGGMLSNARTYFKGNWWVAVFPGLSIVMTVLAFNLLGDGLRDALDPKKSAAG
ncbi:MAG TPA: ABC transporter permease [Planctomycetota bacterium]|nr:ABC transporter permease [Planctomycetota bacterium]